MAMGNNDEINMREACRILKDIVRGLENPKRVEILNALPADATKTFNMLKAETKLSTGSLHHHLKELQAGGYIYKTYDRPAKFGRTNFLLYLLSLVECEKQKIDADRSKAWIMLKNKEQPIVAT